MGMISARLRRLHYVWSWRLRYWWLDTRSGARARAAVFIVSTAVAISQIVYLALKLLESAK